MTYHRWLRLIGVACIVASVPLMAPLPSAGWPLWGFGLGLTVAWLFAPTSADGRLPASEAHDV